MEVLEGWKVRTASLTLMSCTTSAPYVSVKSSAFYLASAGRAGLGDSTAFARHRALTTLSVRFQLSS